MWKDKEVHFADDYFFQDADLATGTAAQVSGVFELGNTLGGIRVHGWLEGDVASASGGSITAVLEVADAADSTGWTGIATNTVTAEALSTSGTGTAAVVNYGISEDSIFSFVPDVEDNYMRVSVSNSTGMTGTFTVAPELIP